MLLGAGRLALFGEWFCIINMLVAKEDAVVGGSRVSFFFFHVNITVDVAARRLYASITRVVVVKEGDEKKQRGQILLVTTEAPLTTTTTVYIPQES